MENDPGLSSLVWGSFSPLDACGEGQGGLWTLHAVRPGLCELSSQWTCPVLGKGLRWVCSWLEELGRMGVW